MHFHPAPAREMMRPLAASASLHCFKTGTGPDSVSFPNFDFSGDVGCTGITYRYLPDTDMFIYWQPIFSGCWLNGYRVTFLQAVLAVRATPSPTRVCTGGRCWRRTTATRTSTPRWRRRSWTTGPWRMSTTRSIGAGGSPLAHRSTARAWNSNQVSKTLSHHTHCTVKTGNCYKANARTAHLAS
jgi:hypothetical protein